MAETIVPLTSRRRELGELFQRVQHLIPAVPLLVSGVQALQRRETGVALALAIGEIVVSLLLVRSMVRHTRAVLVARKGSPTESSHEPHPLDAAERASGIDWFEVLAAGVLAAEALEFWHRRGHLPGPTVLLAAVTLALGLLHGRLAARVERRRALRIGDEGIQIGRRLRFLPRFAARWEELERIELDAHAARFVTRAGRKRRINLDDLVHREPVEMAIRGAQERLAALRDKDAKPDVPRPSSIHPDLDAGPRNAGAEEMR